ncbi:MAG: hypothetical protein HYX63_07010 [Gammaproteobacteria bacterium]|nr:hypothetical protein [Gammaproteobacteria bacterium]
MTFASASAAGKSFASFMRPESYEDEALWQQRFKQWGIKEDIAIFDEWIANDDRTPSNVMFQRPDRFVLIDHSHILTGASWSPERLREDSFVRVSNSLLDQLVSEPANIRQALVERARQLAPNYLDTLALFPWSASLIAREDVDAIHEFLERRATDLPTLVSMRLGFNVLTLR